MPITHRVRAQRLTSGADDQSSFSHFCLWAINGSMVPSRVLMVLCQPPPEFKSKLSLRRTARIRRKKTAISYLLHLLDKPIQKVKALPPRWTLQRLSPSFGAYSLRSFPCLRSETWGTQVRWCVRDRLRLSGTGLRAGSGATARVPLNAVTVHTPAARRAEERKPQAYVSSDSCGRRRQAADSPDPKESRLCPRPSTDKR
jgi:hypothetical protein